MANDDDEPNGPGGRTYSSLGGGANINIAGLSQATQQINQFNTALGNLQSTLSKLSMAAPGQSSTISSSLNKVANSGGPPGGPGGGGGGFFGGIGNVASSMFGSVNEKGWARDLMMFPTRYMRSAVSDNRQLALLASAGLGQQAFGAGTNTQSMMGALAGQFGNVLGGNPADLVNLMNVAGQVGAGVNWQRYTTGGQGGPNGGGNRNAPRTAGFFQSVMEAQRMSPGTDVTSLAQAVGGYAGNIGAQQQSAFLTGGAFSMIGAGNRQKPISEWATGILKWLQNLRGGPQRGQPFTYAELMSQNFPGSNIDAWLTANGVTPDMKGFFWTFALASAGKTQSQMDKLFTDNSSVNTSVAFNRLQASAAETRTGFRLAGTMAGAYSNKEQANQFFAEMTGHMLNQVLPQAMSTGLMSYMQYLPDTIEEIIMQLAERTSVGTLGAGVVGWGSMFQNLLGGGDVDGGDVGDVGDYGRLGGTSTAGMHPDARRRVDAMMQANPRIRMTSGYRDLGTQQRLKKQGVGRVSGKPSAHTRGMAADLGPASEYGWISRNAKRFGLSSGISQGEPWHVGMGHIGDASDLLSGSIPGLIAGLQNTQLGGGLSDLFAGLFKSVFGQATPEEQIKSIGGASSGLMSALMGMFGGGAGVDLDRLKNRNVYDQLVDAANANKGLPTGVTEAGTAGSGWIGRAIGRMLGGGGGGPQGLATPVSYTGPGAGGTSLDSFFREVLSGLGAPITQNNLLKLAAVTKFEGNGSNFNPFNSVGGDFPNKANSVGVENYPDWGTGVLYTTKLLSQQNTSGMRSNLMSDSSYDAWRSSVSAFYGSWGGGAMPNISQGSAEAMLSKPVHGAGDIGDLDYASMGGPMMVSRGPTIFQNSFQINGGGAGGGIDVRRTATLLADQLEQQMQQRMARRN